MDETNTCASIYLRKLYMIPKYFYSVFVSKTNNMRAKYNFMRFYANGNL